MNKKIDVSQIDALVIPREFTPRCATIAVVDVMKEVFGGASASHILSKKPCDKTITIDDEYRQIFENLRDTYRKKDFVYITEMPFFVILHRREVKEILWFYMITSTMKLVETGQFERKNMEITTIPYNMRKLDKKIKREMNE